jgi:CHAD domain-containing protein
MDEGAGPYNGRPVTDVSEHLERELKLSAARTFHLPELPGRPLPRRTFTSTYHDTADYRLARSGVTLRRRVENRRGLWQLKLPRGVARLELEVPGAAAAPPPEITDLLVPYVRGRALTPVAQLRTKRSGVRTDASAGAVADVTLDVVSVSAERRITTSFREVEVELVEGDEKGLAKLGRVLCDAGAEHRDGRPKLFQALGLEVVEEPPVPGRDASPRDHLRAMLAAQYRAIVAHDPGTRLGRDAEELHQMRVATRRSRAFLRAGRPLLDPDWAQSLRLELGWLGGVLGPVRDLDVMIDHLRGDALALEPGERRALRRVFRHLDGERGEAREAMLVALASDRYLALLDRLERAVAEPSFGPDEIPLQELAAAEFRRLRKAARALDPEPADDDLHDLRIRGKRARYAAELAEVVAGKPATRFIREAKGVQDVLGEHQDAVVAEQRLRALVSQVGSSATGFAIGRLVERERERRRSSRAAFPGAWKQLERSGRKAWKT